jgi:hypothetical protein
MSKFKIKLKITGFEMEIEGSRDDIPLISRNLAAQIGGMMTPAANIVEGSNPALGRDAIDITPVAASTGGGRSNKRAARRPATTGTVAEGKPAKEFDWTHDVQSWGNPVQGWNPTQKSLWLLYIVKAQGVTTEMTAGQIANTFNKHFKQAGTIQAGNVSRDLGKAKVQAPAKVGENAAKSPSTWFLTDEGNKLAVELVALGRGLKATSG